MTQFATLRLTKIELLTAALLTLVCAAPALAGTVVYTDENVITPVTVAPATTIRKVYHQPPMTTTMIDTDGAVVQSTTSSSSSETFSETGYARPYHGRYYVPTDDAMPTDSYSRTTVIHSEGQPELPGVMSLSDEANLAITSSADFN